MNSLTIDYMEEWGAHSSGLSGILKPIKESVDFHNYLHCRCVLYDTCGVSTKQDSVSIRSKFLLRYISMMVTIMQTEE